MNSREAKIIDLYEKTFEDGEYFDMDLIDIEDAILQFYKEGGFEFNNIDEVLENVDLEHDYY